MHISANRESSLRNRVDEKAWKIYVKEMTGVGKWKRYQEEKQRRKGRGSTYTLIVTGGGVQTAPIQEPRICIHNNSFVKHSGNQSRCQAVRRSHSFVVARVNVSSWGSSRRVKSNSTITASSTCQYNSSTWTIWLNDFAEIPVTPLFWMSDNGVFSPSDLFVRNIWAKSRLLSAKNGYMLNKVIPVPRDNPRAMVTT